MAADTLFIGVLVIVQLWRVDVQQGPPRIERKAGNGAVDLAIMQYLVLSHYHDMEG